MAATSRQAERLPPPGARPSPRLGKAATLPGRQRRQPPPATRRLRPTPRAGSAPPGSRRRIRSRSRCRCASARSRGRRPSRAKSSCSAEKTSTAWRRPSHNRRVCLRPHRRRASSPSRRRGLCAWRCSPSSCARTFERPRTNRSQARGCLPQEWWAGWPSTLSTPPKPETMLTGIGELPGRSRQTCQTAARLRTDPMRGASSHPSRSPPETIVACASAPKPGSDLPSASAASVPAPASPAARLSGCPWASLASPAALSSPRPWASPLARHSGAARSVLTVASRSRSCRPSPPKA
mmetsp:Transcript_57815/g.155302  ORF Transcript_57815/g.155302 Transcript_57815/m.155302 type:complete len:294 (-) Transcript_57815:60-941(-)